MHLNSQIFSGYFHLLAGFLPRLSCVSLHPTTSTLTKKDASLQHDAATTIFKGWEYVTFTPPHSSQTKNVTFASVTRAPSPPTHRFLICRSAASSTDSMTFSGFSRVTVDLWSASQINALLVHLGGQPCLGTFAVVPNYSYCSATNSRPVNRSLKGELASVINARLSRPVSLGGRPCIGRLAAVPRSFPFGWWMMDYGLCGAQWDFQDLGNLTPL